jgi:YD repeat-containing protein
VSFSIVGRWVSASIQTTYTYDALDRVLTKIYSDGTPSVTYCYDGPCGGPPTAPAIGHLTSVSSSASGTSYTYDQLGRIISNTQTTSGQAYGPFSCLYNLGDGLTQEMYPSGRTVSYCDLSDHIQEQELAASEDDLPSGSFERLLRDYKFKLASDAVQQCKGNKTLAAESLSISRAYLHRLLRQTPATAETGELAEVSASRLHLAACDIS